MAQICVNISEENADLLRAYTARVKRSLKKQSEVVDEALSEFFKNKGNAEGVPCV